MCKQNRKLTIGTINRNQIIIETQQRAIRFDTQLLYTKSLLPSLNKSLAVSQMENVEKRANVAYLARHGRKGWNGRWSCSQRKHTSGNWSPMYRGGCSFSHCAQRRSVPACHCHSSTTKRNRSPSDWPSPSTPRNPLRLFAPFPRDTPA